MCLFPAVAYPLKLEKGTNQFIFSTAQVFGMIYRVRDSYFCDFHVRLRHFLNAHGKQFCACVNAKRETSRELIFFKLIAHQIAHNFWKSPFEISSECVWVRLFLPSVYLSISCLFSVCSFYCMRTL